MRKGVRRFRQTDHVDKAFLAFRRLGTENSNGFSFTLIVVAEHVPEPVNAAFDQGCRRRRPGSSAAAASSVAPIARAPSSAPNRNITKVEIDAPPSTSPSCGQQPLHHPGGPSRSSCAAPESSATTRQGIKNTISPARNVGERARRRHRQRRRRPRAHRDDPVARQGISRKRNCRRRRRSAHAVSAGAIPPRRSVETGWLSRATPVACAAGARHHQRLARASVTGEIVHDCPPANVTTPGAGRDRPGSSTAPPSKTLKMKKPAPPSIQHSISADARHHVLRIAPRGRSYPIPRRAPKRRASRARLSVHR